LLDEPVATDAAEVDPVGSDRSSLRGAQQQALEIAIQQRIESRLQSRVRNLRVRAYGDLVVLDGQCATYYTKQLAQHAAMGVLEDEQLENAIVVSVPQ
jgi:osmotically-inducible protein OsmY